MCIDENSDLLASIRINLKPIQICCYFNNDILEKILERGDPGKRKKYDISHGKFKIIFRRRKSVPILVADVGKSGQIGSEFEKRAI